MAARGAVWWGALKAAESKEAVEGAAGVRLRAVAMEGLA